MRTLKFQLMIEGRSGNEELLPLLENNMRLIEEKLSILPGVEVMRNDPWCVGNMCQYIDGVPATQYRVSYYIDKRTRDVTWNAIKTIVNSICEVCYYEWV